MTDGEMKLMIEDSPLQGHRPILLLVTTVPSTIESFLLPLARRMRSLGWEVNAAAGSVDARPLGSEFDHLFDVPLSRRIADPANVVRGIPAMRQLILETHPDIVHAHTPIASAVARLAVRQVPRASRPAVAYTAHGFHFHVGGNPIANHAFRVAERVLGRCTDRLVVINDEDEVSARRWRLVPPRRLVRMPGIGIDTVAYSRGQVPTIDALLARQRIGIDEATPLFTSIAELNANKRHEKSIEALSRMQRRDVHLAIAGDGPLRDHLESTASQLGVAGRVHFLGFVDDVRPLLAVSTGFVLSSEREGLARSVMEALALEVPVVASDARGNAELVASDSGFIVPGADPMGMAAAMDLLTSDAALAQAMGARGRQRMIESYDQETVIEMHEQLYAAMLSERSR